MTIDFKQQIQATVATLEQRQRKIVEELDGIAELRTVMTRFAEKYGSPIIEPATWPDVNWRVWIPPFREDHFDGDAIVAPFGDTYWPTLAEASEFLDSVLSNIAAGEHGALAPQS